jgi:transposase
MEAAMALSVDLRERVLRAHERREGSQRVLAERFEVGLGTVNEWLRLARAGRQAPLRPRGGPKPLGGVDPALLRELVAERNDATLAEYAAMLAERGVGREFSAATLCRALAVGGMPPTGLGRKKRRSGRPSRSAPTSLPHARRGTRRSPRRSGRSG